MERVKQHKGQCFCGAVQIQVSGEPDVMSYCHCESCRSWSGSPVQTSNLWKAELVEVVAGKEHINTFQKTPESISHRQYCAKCGGHLMISHPDFGIIDIFSATLPTVNFVPTLHVNYAESVLPMADGLPKYENFPSELGGSGKLVAE